MKTSIAFSAPPGDLLTHESKRLLGLLLSLQKLVAQLPLSKLRIQKEAKVGVQSGKDRAVRETLHPLPEMCGGGANQWMRRAIRGLLQLHTILPDLPPSKPQEAVKSGARRPGGGDGETLHLLRENPKISGSGVRGAEHFHLSPPLTPLKIMPGKHYCCV